MIAGFAKTHAFCDTLEYISERRKNTHYLSFMTYLAFQINYISASSMYFGHFFLNWPQTNKFGLYFDSIYTH